MRALLLSLATTGCVISAPEGASQDWPPPLGGTVEAVVSADLDADTVTDIVVFMSGTEGQAGAYYMSGAKDLAFGEANLVATFSTYVPIALTHPVAALVQGTAAPQVFVATGAEMLELSSYANNLRPIVSGAASGVPGGGTAWLAPMVFPGDQQHIAVSDGSTIQHATADLSDVKMLPPNNAASWVDAQTATSYKVGQDVYAIVATATTLYRCVIPMMPPFEFAPFRQGPPWLGQIAYDLDNNGVPEIIGFDPQMHDVCILSADATMNTLPDCIHLDSTATGTEVQILAGINISSHPGPDILVTQASAEGTSYSIVEDVSSTTPFTALGTLIPMKTGPAHGKSVVVTSGTGMPLSLVTFGTDGAATCLLGPC